MKNELKGCIERTENFVKQFRSLEKDETDQFLIDYFDLDSLKDIEMLIENIAENIIPVSYIEDLIDFIRAMVDHNRIMIDVVQIEVSKEEMLSLMSLQMLHIVSLHNMVCDLAQILTRREFGKINDGIKGIEKKLETKVKEFN